MASGRNFIYARIDGSGSGNRGQRLKHSVHGKLGTIEVEDQVGDGGRRVSPSRCQRGQMAPGDRCQGGQIVPVWCHR